MMIIFPFFDRGEDSVSGVLLHHKQVIKPYYLFITVGLHISFERVKVKEK